MKMNELVYRPESQIICAVGLSCLLTLLLKTVPVTVLKGKSFPQIVRRWLDFVPVAVMAALVGPDIFIYDNRLDFSPSNLFLIVSIPTLLVAWKSGNYFLTIAFGIGLVIAARYLGYN